MAEAFVYCWTNIKTNKLYVGVHKGTPGDGYVCSSKLMLEDYLCDPQSFVRQIIAEGDYEDMLNFEKIILKSCNAAKDDQFYNMHNGNGRPYRKSFSEETKNKQSESQKRRWQKITPEKKCEIFDKISASTKGISKTKAQRESFRGKRPHINQKAGMNNNAKKICTPFGVFTSLKEASENLQMKYDAVHYKLKNKHIGWEYL